MTDLHVIIHFPNVSEKVTFVSNSNAYVQNRQIQFTGNFQTPLEKSQVYLRLILKANCNERLNAGA